jgi:hypothetical protein
MTRRARSRSGHCIHQAVIVSADQEDRFRRAPIAEKLNRGKYIFPSQHHIQR